MGEKKRKERRGQKRRKIKPAPLPEQSPTRNSRDPTTPYITFTTENFTELFFFFHHTFHTSRTHNQPPGSSIHRLAGHIGVQDRTFGHLWLLDRAGFPPGDLSAMVDASHLLLRHPLLVKLYFVDVL